jgi:hypothetical protein
VAPNAHSPPAAPETEPDHFGPDAAPLDVYLPLTQATAELPGLRGGGKRPHVSTMYRWRDQGLRTALLGGTVVTTRRWLMEFFAARTRGAAPASNPPRSMARRCRDIKNAQAELAARGFGC